VAQEEEFKSDVTSALYVTLITLPLALILGAILSWYAPYISQADLKYYSLIRITCSILIFGLIINKFFDLFEATLAGMNLAYKRMGFRAAIIAIGGILKVIVISRGYGLIGLSLVQVLNSLVIGWAFYYIVKKNVPWFSFGKTNKAKVKSFGKLSGWYMAYTVLKTLLLSSDKVFFGISCRTKAGIKLCIDHVYLNCSTRRNDGYKLWV
jgi:O-antigen/teichoic acid export membrane protein